MEDDSPLELRPPSRSRASPEPKIPAPDRDDWRPHFRAVPVPEPGALNVAGVVLGLLLVILILTTGLGIVRTLTEGGGKAVAAPAVFLAVPFALTYVALLGAGVWLVRPRRGGPALLALVTIPVLLQCALYALLLLLDPRQGAGAMLLPHAATACRFGPVLALGPLALGRRSFWILLAEVYGAVLLWAALP